MEPTTTRLQLLCIISNIPGSEVFSVKVRRGQIVDKLKKKIKKEMGLTLEYIPKNFLRLYKINIKLSDPIKSKEIMHELCQPNYVQSQIQARPIIQHINLF